MSKGTIFKADGFDPSEFTFSSVKTNNYNGKSAYINCDKHKIRIETPRMLCPWGLSGYPFENPDSYYMTLQFPKTETERMQSFHNKLLEFEERVVQTAMERSKDWLGKKTLKENMAREFYSGFLKKSIDKDGNGYPDSFNLKLRRSNGQFAVKCYGPDKKPAKIEDVLTKGCYVKAIMEFNNIYLKKNQFSSSATALQLRVYPSSRPSGYTFLPDEDDDEVLVLGNLDEVAETQVKNVKTVTGDSSTEESNSDESPTPTKKSTKSTKFSKSKK